MQIEKARKKKKKKGIRSDGIESVGTGMDAGSRRSLQAEERDGDRGGMRMKRRKEERKV